MQIAVRSYLTAGVAAVGVSALAISPITPPVPHLPSPPAYSSVSTVELSALVNPITVFAPIFEKAIADAGALGQRWLANPAPILQQVAANNLASAQKLLGIATAFGESFATAIGAAPGELQKAFTQLQAGQITLAMNTLAELVLMPVLSPLIDSIFTGQGVLQDLVAVIQQPLANVQKVVGLLGDQDFMLTIGLIPLQVVYALNTSIGGTVEAVLAAARDLDLEGVVNAITVGAGNITAAVLDTLLNPGTPPYNFDQGLVAALLSARDKIAAVLAPPVTVPAAKEQSSDVVESADLTEITAVSVANTVKSVTLDLAPTPETLEQSAPTAPAPGDQTPSIPETPVLTDADLETETPTTDGTSTPTDATPPVGDSTEAPTRNPLKELRTEIRGAVKDFREQVKQARAERVKTRPGRAGASEGNQVGPAGSDSGTNGSEGSGGSGSGATSGGSDSGGSGSTGSDG